MTHAFTFCKLSLNRSLLFSLKLAFLVIVLVFELTQDARSADPASGVGSSESGNVGDLPRILPKEPAEALKMFRTRPGFRIELVVAEPLIRDPVAIEFDEQGRMFVVEAPEYNQYAAHQKFEGHGRIKRLEDTDGDGRFDGPLDKATVYVDELPYPTAIACYDGGIFVGAAPDLLYAKDTDGDGQADVRQVVFTGFGADRAGERHMNSLRWGLDNRYYLATSMNGGSVRSVLKEESEAVTVGQSGFVFDPRDLQRFELTSGGGQHGMSMDDWGRRYVCSNGVPMELLMYDGRYLARNPYLEAPAAAVGIAPDGKQTKLYRISPPEPWRVARTRLRVASDKGDYEGGNPFGFFTAATGVTIYRGDAWPESHRGNVLVGEPANNLIYRARPEVDGLGLVAHRADPDVEFIASTDIWFRPVQFAHGPDGALYVIDMYRELIEGADFLPSQLLEHVDSGSGAELGRIYRIVPDGFQQPATPNLGRAATAQLVALLEHRNGWHRDTAARLLYQRQDREAIAPLEKLAAQSTLPQGRTHAMYALDGLGALSADVVLHRLADEHTYVRWHAVRLAEHVAQRSQRVREKLFALVDDPDPLVRYQLAFSLGELSSPNRAEPLAALARHDKGNRWIEMAVRSSLGKGSGAVLALLVKDKNYTASTEGRSFLSRLATQIGRQQQADDVAYVLQLLRDPPDEENVLQTIVKALSTKQDSALAKQLAIATSGRYQEIMDQLGAEAQEVAVDPDRETKERADAIRFLTLSPFEKRSEIFASLLDAAQSTEVQNAVVDALGHYRDRGVANLLVERWRSLSPGVRSRAGEMLFSRPEWIPAVLDAVDEQRIALGDLDPTRLQQLAEHADETIHSRVKALLSSFQQSPRADVLQAYRDVMKLTGHQERGQSVFKKHCAACHRLQGVGHDIAPNLATLQNRGADTILIHVLDPNREVDPKYQNYLLLTEDGQTLTGMIAAETRTSITLQRAEGVAQTILRIDIAQLTSTGTSLMPEGVEKQIDQQAMADLIAYLQSVK